ncbi:hypothetical protein [Escherichia coli]
MLSIYIIYKLIVLNDT